MFTDVEHCQAGGRRSSQWNQALELWLLQWPRVVSNRIKCSYESKQLKSYLTGQILLRGQNRIDLQSEYEETMGKRNQVSLQAYPTWFKLRAKVKIVRMKSKNNIEIMSNNR